MIRSFKLGTAAAAAALLPWGRKLASPAAPATNICVEKVG